MAQHAQERNPPFLVARDAHDRIQPHMLFARVPVSKAERNANVASFKVDQGEDFLRDAARQYMAPIRTMNVSSGSYSIGLDS